MASTQPPTPVVNMKQPTTPHSYKQHSRLLYRGSLSLPESDLILDGISFTAHLPPTSPMSLLESPLPLALESMRGRPSLRLVAVVDLSELKLNYESDGDISMYISSHSTQTRHFFENNLCIDQLDESGHTVNAIRIGLGDGHGPDESDVLVYGSMPPSQSTLKMTVARFTPPPPPAPRVKRPRPDDPSPRRPPMLELSRQLPPRKRRHIDYLDDEPNGSQAKRGKADKSDDLKTLMARETMFKMPLIPMANSKGKGRARPSEQGASFKLPGPPPALEEDIVFDTSTGSRIVDPGDLEASNKTVVKKTAVKALAARGMPKEHPEFRELFGRITHGVGFALRRKINIVKLGCGEVERLVDSHVLMYFDGFGGPVATV